MKAKPESTFNWSFAAQMHMSISGHGLRLVIVVSPLPHMAGWVPVVLETPIGSSAELNNVLDNHAHQALPTQRDIVSAIRIAERYAKAWQRNRQTALKACTCKAITKKKA